MKRIIKFFSSVKLVIFLLICLAFTSIIGTLIAQRQNPALYIQHYGQGFYNFFKFMGFFDVYHSWWFLTLLGLLFLNILFCTLRRLPRDLKRVQSHSRRMDDKMAKEFKLSKNKRFQKSLHECRDQLLSVLERNGLGVSNPQEAAKDDVHIFAEKNRYGWIYFYLTHLSILIILLGGISTATFGLKGYVQIPEGESADRFFEYRSNKSYDLGFIVRCDKFEIEYYPNSRRPKDYRSQLTVFEEGKEILSKVIEVNQPLSYKGMTLYQSSYGEDTRSGELVILVKPIEPQAKESPQEFRVRPGGSFEFTGADGKKRQVRIARLVPDFAMDGQRNVFSKSDQMKNPAIQLVVTKEGEEPFKLWSFQKFPDLQMFKKGNYRYTMKGYTGKMYTGLQVGHDPGVWIVWLGCSLLMLGVILVLFSSHQRIWVRLTPVSQGCHIQAIGHADKNKLGFEKKFYEIWQGITNSLGQK